MLNVFLSVEASCLSCFVINFQHDRELLNRNFNLARSQHLHTDRLDLKVELIFRKCVFFSPK